MGTLFSLLVLAGVFALSVLAGFVVTYLYKVYADNASKPYKAHQFDRTYTTDLQPKPMRTQFDFLEDERAMRESSGIDGENALQKFKR